VSPSLGHSLSRLLSLAYNPGRASLAPYPKTMMVRRTWGRLGDVALRAPLDQPSLVHGADQQARVGQILRRRLAREPALSAALFQNGVVLR
jgi:hypothetical protein